MNAGLQTSPEQLLADAAAALRRGDTAAALAAIARAEAAQPHDAQIKMQRALALRMSGAFPAAISALDEALALDPYNFLALLSKGAFNALKERINPERYGGAPLLGLNGNILKAHGSSNRRAIKSAITAAHEIVRADMNQHIEADIARANELLAQPAFS